MTLMFWLAPLAIDTLVDEPATPFTETMVSVPPTVEATRPMLSVALPLFCTVNVSVYCVPLLGRRELAALSGVVTTFAATAGVSTVVATSVPAGLAGVRRDVAVSDRLCAWPPRPLATV